MERFGRGEMGSGVEWEFLEWNGSRWHAGVCGGEMGLLGVWGRAEDWVKKLGVR